MQDDCCKRTLFLQKNMEEEEEGKKKERQLMVGKKQGGIIFGQEAVCRSDSGADTRDSENTFLASLANERRERARGIPREKRKEREKKVK